MTVRPVDHAAARAAEPQPRPAEGGFFGMMQRALRKTDSPPAPAPSAPAAATSDFQALYASWFATVEMTPAVAGFSPFTIRRELSASEAGAEEALRIVRRHVPGATIKAADFGGKWSPSAPWYSILLPDGSEMNAGLILARHYDHGRGPAAWAEDYLVTELGYQST